MNRRCLILCQPLNPNSHISSFSHESAGISRYLNVLRDDYPLPQSFEVKQETFLCGEILREEEGEGER